MAKEKKEKEEKKEKKGKKEKKEKKAKPKKEKKEKPKKEKKGKKDKKAKPEKEKKQKKGKKGKQEEPQPQEAQKKKAPKKAVRPASPSGQKGVEGAEDAQGEEARKFPRVNLSSAVLHILAMGFMLCDSLWTTVLPGTDWMACLGRLAYPIFAFLLVEGFFHTENLWRYLLRLLGVAILSEIPFNLMYGGSVVYPFHQNVIWTYVIALLFLILLEEFKERFGQLPMLLFMPIPAFLGYFLGQVLFTDYYGAGVLIILMFYLFHGKHWVCFLGQLVCLWFISFKLLGGYYYVVPFLGYDFELVQQGLALLSLVPIWLYYGRQGLHGKVFRLVCYLFYPVHMLLLFILRCKLLL